MPVLSSSRSLNLNKPFSILHPKPSGNRRALLVGINYVGQEGLEITVGHHDVRRMQTYLSGHGYQDEHMRVLLDDGGHTLPTKAAIEENLRWLVAGAKAGDSLLFHYSGHGSTYVDDAADRFAGSSDEALCPVDFRSAGMIFDTDLFRLLISPLREEVHLSCVVDCCQSGTILHLPYAFKAERHEATTNAALQHNEDYDSGKMLQVIQSHPAMCAAAFHWAQKLTVQDPERHGVRKSPLLTHVAASARKWMDVPGDSSGSDNSE